ncbi:glycoside hydrolase family 6 protein [Streptomyces sp. 4N509B]|uniref:glycoside hydrolase family 6 protein n=1 Tax=Streptomyces sp. 4N509B TaxID=3457413 RepID=UPI003FD203EA
MSRSSPPHSPTHRLRRRRPVLAAGALLGAAAIAAGGFSFASADEPSTFQRVDNPYEGAEVYVNPDWSANASASGGQAIADQPTAVWLDRIAAITGGSAGNSTGLEEHLQNAVEQAGGEPLVFQMVTYNLPGRDCSALASNGELGPEEIERYKTEFIDPIAEIVGEYATANPNLRIVNIVEIDSLPNLVTNVGDRETATPECDEMLANGNYQEGVSYNVGTLGEYENVYNYIDGGHWGWIGWENNFGASADLFNEVINTAPASPDKVAGVAVNVANYGSIEEPNFDLNQTIAGTPVRQSSWVDWNQYTNNLDFGLDFAAAVDGGGGLLIDTSRNGWGGPDRPSGPGAESSVDEYVDGGRIDRRIHTGNWCNQAGAGLGERPTASPVSGVDAFVWIKPPGESDGSSEEIPNDEGKGFDRMCDPTYEGNPRNQNNMSGALGGAPLSGHWFEAQFQELMDNAYPPL